MKILLGIPIWALAFLVRAALMVLGLAGVAFSLVKDGQYSTPKMWRWCANVKAVPAYYSRSIWLKYYWMAIRNPLEGLDRTLKQPIPERHPNPDAVVRNYLTPSNSRWMQHGIFWEYWYLRKVGEKFFEFRIGWKFVDGNEDFVPTIQLGLKR